MNIDYMHHAEGVFFQNVLLLLIVLIIAAYVLAAIISGRNHKRWPLYRCICWICGVLSAAAAVTGPLYNRAHTDFTAHMAGHLLLAMLAPLLMAVAAPMTLVLRTLGVRMARRVASLLKSWPVRLVSHPVVASLMNVGGLWVLYTSGLYAVMQENVMIHIIVHVHLFLAGYLFTISMIYIDPTPHPFSFLYRAAVLTLALSAHTILSKHIYAHPPLGVPATQAESAAMLMYYGGDVIDLALIFIFCWQWYKAARPRASLSAV